MQDISQHEVMQVTEILSEFVNEHTKEVNRYSEKQFIEVLLPLLEQAEKMNLQEWFSFSGGPFNQIAIMDNADPEKELFRIPPIIPTYRVPDRNEALPIDAITDRIQNLQHLGPAASNLLVEELRTQGDIMRKKGLVEEEQKGWEYIFETYAKPRALSRLKGGNNGTENTNNTELSSSSQLSFEDEDIGDLPDID